MTNRRLVAFVSCLFAVACSVSLAASPSDRFLFPAREAIYVGVDYYPEHWPEERWETDLAMMKDAGFNIVRVAEFSWVLFEPEEGKYEFDWLDRWLALAKKHDMKVIIGTPTAIMPAWLARKYPEALEMKSTGRTVWGGRRHNCFSDEDFRRLSKGVVRALGEHYANDESVVGWQIDNEFGSADCRCEKCAKNFRNWLKEKYGDLAGLNRAWGTHFWGQRFADWEEIPIPNDRTGDWAISNPSASLDWQRFMSDMQVEYLDMQVKLLRGTCPDSQFITHNFMGLHNSLDYYDLAEKIDFVSWDNYPKLSPAIPYDASLAADVMRGLKKQNFLIMEQTAGPLGWSTFSRNPQPGEMRKICYQQLAHGADGQIWFRWRTATVGREQYWHGLLGHDGKANRRYREAAQVATEYRRLASHLKGTTLRPEAAVIYDYDSIWALQIQKGYPEAGHAEAIKRYYNALVRAGVNVDIVRPGDDVSQYKLVLAPHLHVLADDAAIRLVDFVEKGGVLFADCRTGVKDETNLAYDRTLPGLLSPALGIEIDEYESLALGITDKDETTYKIESPGKLGDRFEAVHYADWIRPTGAEIIARYGEKHLKPYAAVTRNQFGEGVGWYVGTIAKDEAFYDELIGEVLKDAGIRSIVQPPAGVETTIRRDDDRGVLFVINHMDTEQTVKIPADRLDLLTEKPITGRLMLEPFGVAVVELTSEDLEPVRPRNDEVN